MTRQDNPFALLGEDEDGGDVSVLLAKVEAKISSAPAPSPPAEQAKPKAKAAPPAGDGFPSKPLPPSDYARVERGRGRGGRGRGSGRAGYVSAGFDGNADREDSGRQFGSRYPRDFGGDSEGRGRGGGGRGGRGRGRGRSFYEDRGFRQENQFDSGKENRELNADGFEQMAEGHNKSSELRENRGGGYGGQKYGDENMGNGWEEKGNGGEYRGARSGFGGGRGSRGGGRRYVRRDGAGDGRNGGSNEPQEKEVAADEKEQADGIAVTAADGATGWDAPETAEVTKDADLNQSDIKQVSGDVSGEKTEQEEEDKEMTLEEYEKVLQEKRKVLASLRSEERKVVIDKEFQSMQLIEKKKEEDNYVKLNLEKDKKRKESLEKEEKVRKSVSINEFLKPAEGEKYAAPTSGRGRGGGRGRGRGERGGYMGRGGRPDPVFHLQDSQFPQLGAAAKA